MSDRTVRPATPLDLDEPVTVEHTDCCIVGGGPAGALLALLLARQGVAVMLLEAHADFDRDFRGDVLQPAVLDLMGQIGLADRLLAIALARYPAPAIETPSEKVAIQDVSRLRTPYPFLAVVPQTRFLGLIVDEARRYATFRLVLGARAEALVQHAHGQVPRCAVSNQGGVARSPCATGGGGRRALLPAAEPGRPGADTHRVAHRPALVPTASTGV